jgi:hypothetical protein
MSSLGSCRPPERDGALAFEQDDAYGIRSNESSKIIQSLDRLIHVAGSFARGLSPVKRDSPKAPK